MKKVLFVADMHVGSKSGLTVPEVWIEPEHGGRSQRIEANSIQRECYERWCTMAEMVGPVDIVVANGDLVDGVNPASRGLGTWTTSLDLQAEVAASLLDMIDASKYVVTQGSPYHTSINMSGDQAVARNLSHAEWKGIQTIVRADDVRIHVRHKIGYSSVPYGQHTAPAKDATWVRLNKDVYGDVDIKVMSHVHRFSYDGDEHILNITTPCWKWNDDFTSGGSTSLPSLGYVVVEADGSEYTWSRSLFRLDLPHTLDEVIA